MTAVQPPPSALARVRRWLPWLVGVAIVVVLVRRIPIAAFRSAITQGPNVQLAAADLAMLAVALGTDSFATWIGLFALRARRPLGDVAAVRGATYLLVLLNYAVGQGGFGYYLHRSGMSSLRATGAMLFLVGTNLAALLLITPLAWLAFGMPTANDATWWLVVIGCSGFALYLVVIALAPAVLARRELLAPLFEAGLRGHALAVVGRLPHVAAVILAQWVALRVWGIAVPFAAAATMMATVTIASSLPISPSGLGTSQAAFVYFFSVYAVGATADDRSASVLAFSIAHFVYSMLASALVGLACAPFARRVLAAHAPSTPEPSAPEPT